MSDQAQDMPDVVVPLNLTKAKRWVQGMGGLGVAIIAALQVGTGTVQQTRSQAFADSIAAETRDTVISAVARGDSIEVLRFQAIDTMIALERRNEAKHDSTIVLLNLILERLR